MKDSIQCITLFVTILIALTIFITSSIPFKGSPGIFFNIKPFVYHLGIFFFLGIFLTLSMTNQKHSNNTLKLIILSIIIAIIYGILDEVHQIFVPGRYFDYLDILTDTIGIMIANVFYVFWIKSS